MLKRLIAARALELMQLLEHCNDSDFIDIIINAIAACDYAALDGMEDADNEDT